MEGFSRKHDGYALPGRKEDCAVVAAVVAAVVVGGAVVGAVVASNILP